MTKVKVSTTHPLLKSVDLHNTPFLEREENERFVFEFEPGMKIYGKKWQNGQTMEVQSLDTKNCRVNIVPLGMTGGFDFINAAGLLQKYSIVL